jgi:hypothetical protein
MTIAESIQLNKEQIARAFGVPAHMLADPDRTAVPRTWSLCMTSENHGTVGRAGDVFSHAPGKHERVLVVEVPTPANAPIDRVDLRVLTGTGAARTPMGELVFGARTQHAAGKTVEETVEVPAQWLRNLAQLRPEAYSHDGLVAVTRAFCDTADDYSAGIAPVFATRAIERQVPAQAGQVSVPSQSWESIGPVPVDRDENGWWSHPAVPNFDEDVDSYLAWVKAIGLEMKYKALESDPDHPLYDAWFEHGECNASSWNPEEPAGGGWFTFSIHDSEDGPIWAWARRVDRAASLTSTSGERQEGSQP